MDVITVVENVLVVAGFGFGVGAVAMVMLTIIEEVIDRWSL